MKTIQIVDVSEIGLGAANPTEDDYKDIGQKLYDAFAHIGFVYIKNHGIDEQLAKNVYSASDKFFNLDLEVKKKYAKGQKYSDINGYVQQNIEHLSTISEYDDQVVTKEIRESYNVIGTYENDAIFFPEKEVPEFGQSFKAIFGKLTDLSTRIFRSISWPLNVDKDFFVNTHDKINTPSNCSTLRSCYYPALSGPVEKGSVRCAEHADYGSLTFLFQDSMGGLQVLDVDHDWVDATPIEGTLLINVGDMLEIYTNGKFPATRHRVVIPEEETKKKKARHSLAFFTGPNDGVVVDVLHGEKPNNPKYKPKTMREHVIEQHQATFG